MRVYKLGSDIIHSEQFVKIDNSGNKSDIALSTLLGYGIEIFKGRELIGRWGYNLTGYTDDYYTASGNELTFKFPASEFTDTGVYYGRLKIKYTDTGFSGNERNLETKNKLEIFRIENP